MGKKSRYKEIKRALETLPNVGVLSLEKHIVKGQELIDQGIFKADKKIILPDEQYINNMPVIISFNHKRKLKKLVNKFGNESIKVYTKVITEQYKK